VGWTTGVPFPAMAGKGFFSSPPRPNRIWGPHIQRVRGALTAEIKRAECKAHHSPPSPQYVFRTRYLVKHRDNFPFTFHTVLFSTPPVPHQPRAIYLWVSNTPRSSYFSLAVESHTFFRLNYPLRLNRWYHSCTSWNGRTGEWQIWVNAERVGRGFHNRVSIFHFKKPGRNSRKIQIVTKGSPAAYSDHVGLSENQTDGLNDKLANQTTGNRRIRRLGQCIAGVLMKATQVTIP